MDWIARRSQRIVGKEILVGNSASEVGISADRITILVGYPRTL